MVDTITIIIIVSVWAAGLLGTALLRYITAPDRRVVEHADWNGHGNLRHYKRSETTEIPPQNNNQLTETLLPKILSSKNA